MELLRLFAVFLAVLLGVEAAIVLPGGQSLTSFDLDWSFRERADYNISGILTDGISFIMPACTAVTTRILARTDIVHVHLPKFALSANCSDAGTVAQSLTQLYTKNGTVFAALILSFDLEETTGNQQLTPWGDPNLLQIAPFKISLAPKSTAMTLWNVTNNYTTLPLIQLTSDAGPWNDHLKGTASNIYNGFLTALLFVFFCYSTFLHVEQFRINNGCVLPFNIKTWIYICIQFFISFQILFMWVPSYPSVLSTFFFWYSYMFGFSGYSLVLLTWVRVVSHDKNGKTTLSKYTANIMHIFTYTAMSIFFLIMTAAVVANPFPQNMILQAIRNYMYYVMPVILVGQAALFLYYGIRLIRLLTTFTMTEEKRSLMKRMSVLMAVAVGCFILAAFMAIVVILFGTSLTGMWIARALRDVSIVSLILVIFFTLDAGRTARMSSSQTGSASGRSQGNNGKGSTSQGKHTSMSVSMMSDSEKEPGDEFSVRSNSAASNAKMLPSRQPSHAMDLVAARQSSVDSMPTSPRLPPPHPAMPKRVPSRNESQMSVAAPPLPKIDTATTRTPSSMIPAETIIDLVGVYATGPSDSP